MRKSPNGGALQWLTTDGEKEIVLRNEPDSTWWQRVKLWFLRPLVPEEQL